MELSPMHIVALIVIFLVFFGPSKLPQLGKSLGEAIRGFKSAMNDVNDAASTAPPPAQAPSQTQAQTSGQPHVAQQEAVVDPLQTPVKKDPVGSRSES